MLCAQLPRSGILTELGSSNLGCYNPLFLHELNRICFETRKAYVSLFLLSNTYSYLSDGAASFKKKISKNKAMFDELLNAMDMVGFLDEVKTT